MAKHDVVFILKNNYTSEELRYSLRSVVQNFPHRKIVFVGGCPQDIVPDVMIPDDQVGSTKAERSTHSLKKALADDRLTEDIWLFNDDFFIMDKPKEDVNYFNGTLEKRIEDIKRVKGASSYVRGLEIARGKLFQTGKDTLSFALHVPMLINRAQALALFEQFPTLSFFRSFYGNYYAIECRYMKDVKVTSLESIPGTPYISTSDDSFNRGKVGEFLRQYFDKPTKYEKDGNTNSRLIIKERYTEEGEIRYES